MTKRETRVINAFINCVKTGEYTYDYAVTLLESEARYGYLSAEAKEVFYAEFEKPGEEPVPEEEAIPEEV